MRERNRDLGARSSSSRSHCMMLMLENDDTLSVASKMHWGGPFGERCGERVTHFGVARRGRNGGREKRTYCVVQEGVQGV